MAHNRPNLLSVILQMDPKDVTAIAGIHLVPAGGCYQASFTLLRWTPDTTEDSVTPVSGRAEFVQQPGTPAPLSSRESVADQVRAVQDSGRLIVRQSVAATDKPVRFRTSLPETPRHSLEPAGLSASRHASATAPISAAVGNTWCAPKTSIRVARGCAWRLALQR